MRRCPFPELILTVMRAFPIGRCGLIGLHWLRRCRRPRRRCCGWPDQGTGPLRATGSPKRRALRRYGQTDEGFDDTSSFRGWLRRGFLRLSPPHQQRGECDGRQQKFRHASPLKTLPNLGRCGSPHSMASSIAVIDQPTTFLPVADPLLSGHSYLQGGAGRMSPEAVSCARQPLQTASE